jgi:hypothetical protein
VIIERHREEDRKKERDRQRERGRRRRSKVCEREKYARDGGSRR